MGEERTATKISSVTSVYIQQTALCRLKELTPPETKWSKNEASTSTERKTYLEAANMGKNVSDQLKSITGCEYITFDVFYFMRSYLHLIYGLE